MWSVPNSMVQKQWKIRVVDQHAVMTLAKSLSLSLITATVLIGRGVEQEQVKRWFSTSEFIEHDPFRLPDMEKAVDRLHRAVEEGEQICFYGDYDVDGISATSLHLAFFSKLGIKPDIYIPHREDEGYGLNIEAIKKLADQGISVLITSDCGTTSYQEIELANSFGIDVIVTDHHQIQHEFPKAFAFVNPYRKDSTYPFQGLCSGGLAYKLVEAYALKYQITKDSFEGYRDLVALATIADMVPLQDENRFIVRDGLAQITKGSRCGIRALKQVLGITETCSANTVGFRLAPVINAAGRLAHGELGVRLLISESEYQAIQLAQKLVLLNRQRRHIEQEIFQQAKEILTKQKQSSAIVIGSQNWHAGVIGIVASRLVEEFHRPSVVIAFDKNGLGKGSVRSVPGYNVYQALEQCGTHLERFGGHPAAAGLTIFAENFSSFQQKFTKIVAAGMDETYKTPALNIDVHVGLSDIQPSLLHELSQLSPFGIGNPEPIFLATGLRVLEKKIVGDDHLKLVVRQDGSVPVEAIGFRMGGLRDIIDGSTQFIDMVFMPELHRWRGYDRVQLRIRDLRVNHS